MMMKKTTINPISFPTKKIVPHIELKNIVNKFEETFAMRRNRVDN